MRFNRLLSFTEFVKLTVYLIILLLLINITNYGNLMFINCYINNKFHEGIYFIPFCTYDFKLKDIILYGYYKTINQSKYIYQQVVLKNTLNHSYLNISLKRFYTKKKDISLCIVSIYKNINIINLIRTSLLYRRLGVDHITLYVSYINLSTIEYYRWLKTRYWIEVIFFSIPNISFFYFGQDAKLNHCINHYRYISNYVIVTDIDEVIVPKKKTMLIDIINNYGKNNYVFSFKSVLYNISDQYRNIFETSKKGCIISKGFEKMILRPEKIIMIGAHFPKIWQERGNIVYVSVNDSYVRHARSKRNISICNSITESEYIINVKEEIEKEIVIIPSIFF